MRKGFLLTKSVAFSQGSLSCDGLIHKACSLIQYFFSQLGKFPDTQCRQYSADSHVALCLILFDRTYNLPDKDLFLHLHQPTAMI